MPPEHEHEAWQIQDDGEGNRYCAACGQHLMLTRCTETESGGWQCEAWLTEPSEEHEHFISQATIEGAMDGSG